MTNVLDPVQKLIGAVPGVIGAIVWITHGLQSVIGSNGLSSWVDSHPLGLLLVVVCPILFSTAVVGIGVVLSRGQSTASATGSAHLPLLVGTSTLSLISTLLLSGLLLTIVVRPSWCPGALCPQPPGPHDQHLEAALTAIESSAYVLPEDPSRYSLAHLPASTGASATAVEQTIAQPGSSADPPYRVVIRVHSLEGGNVGMFIEWARLRIRTARAVPQPLRVWMKGAPLDYRANPYRTKYSGESPGTDLATVYGGAVPNAHVQLEPGESDELGISLVSQLEGELRFQVVIGYRISSEQEVRTLVLPYVFGVIFSNPINWQRYQLRDGRFAPV